MMIREFFRWAEHASAGQRAEAARVLAKAFLEAGLEGRDLADVSRALTLLLDDSSPLVRRALAESLAAAPDAPHHIIATLAGDCSAIAALVLERSPVLSDAELIDAVALGDAGVKSAVARRVCISAALAGAIAEVGDGEAVLTLSRNPGADLTDYAMRRMLARFGHDATLRDALGGRDDLGAETRHALVLATARALGDFASGCGWMAPDRSERVVEEACGRATLGIVSFEAAGDIDRRRFVSYLRVSGHLTPALLLRAILSGNLAMVETMLSELSGKGSARVGGLLRSPHGLGFAALYTMSGLPAALLPGFRAALMVAIDHQGPGGSERNPRLDRDTVEAVIEACAGLPGEEAGRFMALLRRFEMEAVREEARAGFGQSIAPPRASSRDLVRSGTPQRRLGEARAAA